MFLGCRAPCHHSAIAAGVAVDPQYVCGAAASLLHQPSEIKSEHRPSGELRQDPNGGKRKKSALRGSLSLDHGGPSKELRRGRDDQAGVLAGVLPTASPQAFARRVTLWTVRARSDCAEAARRGRTDAVPGCSLVAITRAS
jgi:hypothetical protein